MMKQRCKDALQKALGRSLLVNEAKDIVKKINENYRQLAIKDEQGFLALSEADRLTAAAAMTAKQIQADLKLKQLRIAKTILANNRIQAYKNITPGLFLENGLDRLMSTRGDGYDKGSESIESTKKARFDVTIASLSDSILSLGPKFLGLLSNDKAMIPVFSVLRGGKTKIKVANDFAKLIKETFENLRLKLNAEGFNIGKLADYGTPQNHSARLIYKAGMPVWRAFIKPLLEPSKYMNTDGTRMNSEQMDDFLAEAFKSIVYNGQLKNDAPEYNRSVRANRNSAHRQLHFKQDGVSYLKYHQKFSEMALMSTIVNHISRLTTDLALVERFGPNPDLMFETWLKKSIKEAGEAGMAPDKINRLAKRAQDQYDYIAGHHVTPSNEVVARGVGAARQYMNILLGSSLFTSLADQGTAYVTARALNMSFGKFLKYEAGLVTSAEKRRHARRLGLGLDTVIFALNRFHDENMSIGMSGRVSGAVVRAGFMPFFSEAARQAFGKMMMDAIGHMTKTTALVSDLIPHDNRILLSKNINQATWDIWRQAKLEDGLLTTDSIMAIKGVAYKDLDAAAQKLMSIIVEEVDFAIITPGAREKAGFAKIPRGELGELAHTAMQFKMFPFAMITKHWRRAMVMPSTQGKVVYAARLIAATTLLGGLGVQLNELANGRDPLPMFNYQFLFRAMVKGGALSFLGDYIQSETNQYGRTLAETLAGPLFSQAASGLDLTIGNLVEATQDKKTYAGAEAVRLAQTLTPGTSVWWLKGLLVHLVFQNLQEMASPGYLAKTTARARKEFNQKYYAPPGQFIQRPPDLSRVFSTGN